MDETPDPTPTDHHPGSATRRRRFAAPAVAAAVLVGALAAAAFAVTGAGDDGSPTPAADRSPQEEAAYAFAGCMRDNGIEDFPDPVVDDDGGISIGDALADQRDSADFQAAEAACESALDAAAPAPPGSTLPPDEVADLQEQWLAVADCVRAQGHEIDDPHVDEYGRPQVQAETRAVEQALETCVQDSELTRRPLPDT